MKQFFKMMFASMFGVFIAIALFMIIGFIMMIGIASSIGSSNKVYVPKSNEKVMELSLNGTLNETSTENPFAALMGKEETLSLKDILEAIDVAKNNDKIKGIYIDASTLSAGTPKNNPKSKEAHAPTSH